MPKARIIKIILVLVVILLITTVIYFFRGELFNINSKKSIDNDIEKNKEFKKLKFININNTFMLRLINSIQYKDVVIGRLYPVTNRFLPDSLETEFHDWFILAKYKLHTVSQTNIAKQSPLPVYSYNILATGGDEYIDREYDQPSPFMVFLRSQKVFDKMKICKWDYLIRDDKRLDIPLFKIECFPYDIKRENCDYKKLQNKAEKNKMIVDRQINKEFFKTKYSDLKMECSTRNEISQLDDSKKLDLMSAVGHEIIDIAEKSKINSIKRIKLTYEHQLVKTLIELYTDYDSVRCFFSNLTSSDYLFMIKLFGVNNPSFRVEAINKQRKINVFSKAKCVILIEFPVGVGVQ